MRASHLFGPHFISETKYHHYFWENVLILADIRPICKSIYKDEANCWATSGQIQQIWSTLSKKIGEHIVKICELLEIGAVQKRVNRVDLKNAVQWIFTCKHRLRYNWEGALQIHILTCAHPQIAEYKFHMSGSLLAGQGSVIRRRSCVSNLALCISGRKCLPWPNGHSLNPKKQKKRDRQTRETLQCFFGVCP